MNISKKNIAVIILAAGLGKRMKSSDAKVLNLINKTPMVLYVVEQAVQIAEQNVILVVGHQAEKVKKSVAEQYNVIYAFQKEQLGTGHAVLCALPSVPASTQEIVVLCGDVPLLTQDTLRKFIKAHLNDACAVTVLGVEAPDPKGYGRLLFDEHNQLNTIVEEADATNEQKKITTVNAGIYCINKEFLLNSINEIKSENAQKEFYLTDMIGIAYAENRKTKVVIADEHEEVIGINTLEELKIVESILLKRL
ncbi:NTP transferase domain-containing protein [Desulfococcaceae bacterium HSG9]|nr:NTP transferase domain-containing protein [Desulfococcaceae bacterium HSG9]